MPASVFDSKATKVGADTEAALEAALVGRAFRGDRQSFGELVRRYQRLILGLCRRYLAAGDAEDMAQETFVRAFVHRDRFDPTRPLAPWLLSIARRLCIDRLRKSRPERLSPLAPLDRPDLDGGSEPARAEAEAIARQELRRVEAALQKLAEGPREALLLYYVENLAYREIAIVLGVPMGTVMTWLHRGRAELKRVLAAGPAEGEENRNFKAAP